MHGETPYIAFLYLQKTCNEFKFGSLTSACFM